jgi:hypothetical protein
VSRFGLFFVGRNRVSSHCDSLGDARAPAWPIAQEGRTMTQIQGWIVIVLIIVVIFSQWFIAGRK